MIVSEVGGRGGGRGRGGVSGQSDDGNFLHFFALYFGGG